MTIHSRPLGQTPQLSSFRGQLKLFFSVSNKHKIPTSACPLYWGRFSLPVPLIHLIISWNSSRTLTQQVKGPDRLFACLSASPGGQHSYLIPWSSVLSVSTTRVMALVSGVAWFMATHVLVVALSSPLIFLFQYFHRQDGLRCSNSLLHSLSFLGGWDWGSLPTYPKSSSQPHQPLWKDIKT